MSKFLIFTTFLFLLSCKSEPKAVEETTEQVAKPVEKQEVTEDDLIVRLSGDLFADPVEQVKKDRNTIVNFAIDNLIDVQGTPTGLYYQILEPGTGKAIKWSDRLKAHYQGKFLDGTVFDSSLKRGEPITFYVGNMVMGWNEGLQLIKTGGKIRLLVPSNLAYGEEGFKMPDGKELIPPNTILDFEIEVLEHLGTSRDQ